MKWLKIIVPIVLVLVLGVSSYFIFFSNKLLAEYIETDSIEFNLEGFVDYKDFEGSDELRIVDQNNNYTLFLDENNANLIVAKNSTCEATTETFFDVIKNKQFTKYD